MNLQFRHMTNRQLGKFFRKGLESINPQLNNDQAMVVFCSQTLVEICTRNGTDHAGTELTGFSVEGIPFGDWKIIVRQTNKPEFETKMN